LYILIVQIAKGLTDCSWPYHG